MARKLLSLVLLGWICATMIPSHSNAENHVRERRLANPLRYGNYYAISIDEPDVKRSVNWGFEQLKPKLRGSDKYTLKNIIGAERRDVTIENELYGIQHRVKIEVCNGSDCSLCTFIAYGHVDDKTKILRPPHLFEEHSCNPEI